MCRRPDIVIPIERVTDRRELRRVCAVCCLRFVAIDAGEIPPQLGELEVLEKLGLYENKLTGK